MKMNKKKGIISLILMAVVIIFLGFTTAVGFGKTGTGAMRNIKLGLDLAGGVSITYQVEDENPTAEQMSDTIYKLQLRVEQNRCQPDPGRAWKAGLPGISDLRRRVGDHRGRRTDGQCAVRTGRYGKCGVLCGTGPE